MSSESYLKWARKHLSDCEKYGIPLEDATFDVMHMAEDYEDEEVELAFGSLPSDVVDLARKKIDRFNRSGECYVISSTGVEKDISKLMSRLSRLI